MGLKKILKREDIPLEVKNVVKTELEKHNQLKISFKELEKQYKDLKRSENRFRSLFEGVPLGLYRISPNGRFLAANRFFLEMLGLDSIEELSVVEVDDIASEKDYSREAFLKIMEREGEVKGLEGTFKRHDGTIAVISENAKAIKDENGSILYYEGSFEDITEPKQAEETIRKSEAKFKRLFKEAPIPLRELDLSEALAYINSLRARGINDLEEYFKYNLNEIRTLAELVKDVSMNDSALKLFGVENLEQYLLIRMKIWDARDERENYEIIKHYLRFLSGETIVEYPYTLTRNRKKSINLLRAIVVPGYEDTLSQIIVANVDITEIKKSEEHLRYQANLLKNVSDAVISTDLNFQIRSWNKAAEKIYGWTEEEVMEKPISEVTLLEYPYDEEEDVINRFMEDEYWHGEVLQYRKDGSPVNILSSVTLLKNETGIPTTSLAINRDITDQKKTEKLRKELEQRRDNFVWMTSHELRTPLTVILGYTEFLQKNLYKITQNQQEKMLSIIKRNLNRLESITNMVSNLAQQKYGTFSIKTEELNLRTFFTEALEPYQAMLGEKIRFNTSSISSPLIIKGDRDRLLQVIENILNNAIKHTHPDNRIINVNLDFNSTNIQIEIRDNGAGIAPENLKRIFDQFVSIETEFSATGTGIGLYLSQKIIEAHEGQITAKSDGLGQGSSFLVTLPYVKT
jgi:PAS domain S-box-containing protein